MGASVSSVSTPQNPEDRSTKLEAPFAQSISRVNDQLILWLMQVQYHARSASVESLQTLQELARIAPNDTNNFPTAQLVLDAVNGIAQSKNYDPTLLSKADVALIDVIKHRPLYRS